jgi:hypothetical protein
MSLETGNRIPSMVPTNPVGATDFASQGDDHIRLIKACVQGSLPNIGATAMTCTAEELNVLDGATVTTAEINRLAGIDSNIQDQIDSAIASSQPLDSDLSAIAALATTSFGRDFLTLANLGALATKIAALIPSWSQVHTHAAQMVLNKAGTSGFSAGALLLQSAWPGFYLDETGGAANEGHWEFFVNDGVYNIRYKDDANGAREFLQAEQTGHAVTSVIWGNDTDAPTWNIKAASLSVNGKEVGDKDLYQRTFSGDSNTTAADRGTMLTYVGAGGHTLTLDADIPNNGALLICNAGSGALTVARSGSMYWFNGSGSAPEGARTLAVGGVATVRSSGSGNYSIWGGGLS